MKKIITLFLGLFCVLSLNAQITPSGNGFLEAFDYEDGTTFDDVIYEGVWMEWPADVGAVVMNGVLEWAQEDEGEASFGGEFESAMDLTGHVNLHFKYQFPIQTETVIYLADEDGGEGELLPTLILGTDELQSASVDLSEAEIDVTKLVAFYIITWTPLAGDLYLDDVVLGDAESPSGIHDIVREVNNLVYPNPSTSEISVKIDAQRVSILNTIGQEELYIENYKKGSTIYIDDLKPGVYFVRMDDFTQKILVK
jgi:hypothetical protein